MFQSERLTGALLDRLTHHVHILELNGNSYRLKHSASGVDPFPWTVDGLSGSSQLMMLPFVFDRREIAQRRMAA